MTPNEQSRSLIDPSQLTEFYVLTVASQFQPIAVSDPIGAVRVQASRDLSQAPQSEPRFLIDELQASQLFGEAVHSLLGVAFSRVLHFFHSLQAVGHEVRSLQLSLAPSGSAFEHSAIVLQISFIPFKC
jgi:hypothetical protein